MQQAAVRCCMNARSSKNVAKWGARAGAVRTRVHEPGCEVWQPTTDGAMTHTDTHNPRSSTKLTTRNNTPARQAVTMMGSPKPCWQKQTSSATTACLLLHMSGCVGTCNQTRPADPVNPNEPSESPAAAGLRLAAAAHAATAGQSWQHAPQRTWCDSAATHGCRARNHVRSARLRQHGRLLLLLLQTNMHAAAAPCCQVPPCCPRPHAGASQLLLLMDAERTPQPRPASAATHARSSCRRPITQQVMVAQTPTHTRTIHLQLAGRHTRARACACACATRFVWPAWPGAPPRLACGDTPLGELRPAADAVNTRPSRLAGMESTGAVAARSGQIAAPRTRDHSARRAAASRLPRHWQACKVAQAALPGHGVHGGHERLGRLALCGRDRRRLCRRQELLLLLLTRTARRRLLLLLPGPVALVHPRHLIGHLSLACLLHLRQPVGEAHLSAVRHA